MFPEEILDVQTTKQTLLLIFAEGQNSQKRMLLAVMRKDEEG